MEPKEKAKELVEKFGGYKTKTGFIIVDIEIAKQCALICIEECIKAVDECVDYPYYSDLHYTDWQEVKQELLKLQ